MHDPVSTEQADAPLINGGSFALLAHSITDYAICTLDAQGCVHSWNPGAEKMLRYRAAEVLGQHFSLFYSGDYIPVDSPDFVAGRTTQSSFEFDDPAAGGKKRNSEAVIADEQTAARLKAVLLKAVSQGTTEAYVWCVRKDNSRFQARAVMSVMDTHTSTEPGFLLVIQNLSESMTVQQALHESEERFRILVEGVHDYAIYMLDPEGNVTNWNSGAALIKGYAKDEIVGRNFSCFYTPQDQAGGEPQRSLDLALKHNTFQSEAWRVRKDGSEFFASIVIDPVFDENHTLIGYAKVTRDITAQKLAQDKVVQQRDAMHQSQKLEAIGRLTGSVAHDFNNFLAIIRTAAELLETSTTLTPEKRSRYTRMILDTTHRAARLIDQLLSFARRQPLQRQVFSIDARIQEFKPMIDTTMGSRLNLAISFEDDLAPVETDPGQFETAVLNMLINARDATPPDGTITIRGYNATLDWLCSDGKTEKRAFTALSISDTGVGIEPSVLANIFEPFFTTKDIDKGTGLGLSQVYGFAKQSGGDVMVESQVGKGTCFTLYLPCASRETQGWDAVLSPLAQRMLEQSHD